jgi:hypothetical protein
VLRRSRLFCLLLAAGCSSASPVRPTPVDASIVLAPGQTARVADDLSVGFVGVIGDSRCPADAICISAGEAIVRIDVAASTGQAQRDLRTGGAPVLLGGVRLELLELAPYPLASRPTEPGDYRATLRVTR